MNAGARDNGALVGAPVVEGDWEYQPVRLPPDVTRISATVQLGIRAEFGGWELSRVRLYSDGTRKVLLKRKKPPRGDRTPPAEHRGRGGLTGDEDAQAC